MNDILARLSADFDAATTAKQQQELAEQIAALGTEAAFDVLLHYLADERTEIAGAAAFGLGVLGDTKAVGPLIAVLETQRRAPYLLSGAINALGKLKDKRAVQPLINALDNMGFLELSQVQIADDIDLYLELLKSRLDRIYVSRPYTIVDILGDLGDKRAVEPLIKILEYRTMIPAPAIAALGKLGDERALSILATYLDDESDVSRWGGGPVKKVAIWAIENIKRNAGEAAHD